MPEMGTFEAARVFDVSPVTLLQLIAQGRLQAHKDGDGRWRINRQSLEQWNQKRLGRRRKASKVGA
jgi:excisionase family DNA binding protein